MFGRGRNLRGRSFEQVVADDVLEEHLLPFLAKKFNVEDTKSLIILRNMKLGMASNKGKQVISLGLCFVVLKCMWLPWQASQLRSIAWSVSAFMTRI